MVLPFLDAELLLGIFHLTFCLCIIAQEFKKNQATILNTFFFIN